MQGFVRSLGAFALGVVVTLGIGWQLMEERRDVVRPQNGVILGGYLLPDGLGRLRVQELEHNIDGTTYYISVDNCPEITIWDVSASGVATGTDVVEFVGSSDGTLLKYQTSAEFDFLHDAGLEYFTRVRTDQAASNICASQALMEIFSNAWPIYANTVN